MSDLDDDELRETRKFYLEIRYDKDTLINQFKRWIDHNYEDIINNETIELYAMIYELTEDEKNILRKRFL